MSMTFTHEREFTYTRSYRGPIRCVILDWAGTTMDFGCMAPAVVFRKVFAKAGVPISLEEARVPLSVHAVAQYAGTGYFTSSIGG